MSQSVYEPVCLYTMCPYYLHMQAHVYMQACMHEYARACACALAEGRYATCWCTHMFTDMSTRMLMHSCTCTHLHSHASYLW